MMETKKMIYGTLAGALTFFLLGFLFYGIVFREFFEANGGIAKNVMKDPPVMWALIVGEICYGALYTFIFL